MSRGRDAKTGLGQSGSPRRTDLNPRRDEYVPFMPPGTAERTVTHELYDDDIPLSAIKEQWSRATLDAIAAPVALDVSSWKTDYDGFDVTLRSDHDYGPTGVYGPKLDIQLKCTSQQRVLRDDHVAWQLDARTAGKLSTPNRGTMAILCVAVTPEHPGHWLEWPEGGLLAYSRTYFLRGSEIAVPGVGQESQVVHLPYANLLTPISLRSLMEEAANWVAS